MIFLSAKNVLIVLNTKKSLRHSRNVVMYAVKNRSVFEYGCF